jgi:hypothetical protein
LVQPPLADSSRLVTVARGTNPRRFRIHNAGGAIFFAHTPNPIFAAYPFTLTALTYSASVLALRKFRRQICDEWSPQ